MSCFLYMVYKHPYFKLDTESKKVFDENSKELALTGNAYRLLVFLCDKNNATLTGINDYFDPAGAKDYTENHVRQYRYKINSLIGHGIVAYKNNVYSINGTVSKHEVDADLESAAPKTQEPEKNNPTEDTDRDIHRKYNPWIKELSSKEKLVIFSSIILLIIFSAVVLRDKNKNAGVTTKSSLADETTANFSPKPQNDMILIPAGEFLMGSTEKQAIEAWQKNDGGYDKEDYLAEYPQQKIMLGDFYIDKKEASNSDYKMFVDATNHIAPALWSDQNLNSPNQPVVGVDWNDADAYCRWLGKKLPTEAEWEKAARGADGRIWPWGNAWDGAMDNHGNGTEYGFDESDGYKYTAPVGAELGTSPYGALNMAGNAYEWVADDFSAYSGNDKFVQQDFNKGFKVIKGGAYTDGQSDQRPASRIGYQKDYKDVDTGFRCAKSD
ncbi:MAG: SUMF1/EgtB/PvdO family nonheme iron enzyme [Candidatus Moranbacteria bacterium]|nr:SUMF1/EgtB/PvdO family nonheme iron enzyme [Candidatus Moranbacteria bacterium]